MAAVTYINDFHEAELNAERVMREWGFTDAVATTGGADGGIDVRSSTALAQVKWKGGVAGRPEIQRLYGARGGDHQKQLFFFDASGYSKDAVKYADQVDVRLFRYNPLGEAEPMNRRASDFLATLAGKGSQAGEAEPPAITFSTVVVTLVVVIGIAIGAWAMETAWKAQVS
ncbi:restriction endonuclease [Prescottella equi]|uniref:restriction endonuclease n=1 Tax=Rhodococcus hoagii TaxID=43767 RepID=UPI001F5B323A|nr:restriction endonuclease [Prescottella equi]UNQ40960.1 restriction endonuclease [Prescottella equi]